jgi:hypothetical protein
VRQNEALMGARGQIVWILALVLSTVAIIYLERLEIGVAKPIAEVSAELSARATEAMIAAEQRHRALPGDPKSAAALVLALSVAVQAGGLEASEGRARVERLRSQTTAATPEWEAVAVLADITFGE